MALGRISGPLLKANLVRDGVNLAFETDLLYLDVVNSRVGVNNSSPDTDFHVSGTTHSTNLVVDTQLNVGNIQITGNTISSNTGTISFAPAAQQATIYQSILQIGQLQATGNVISSTVTNTDINISPNGSGKVNFNGNTQINGNLAVTGNLVTEGNYTIGGDITIGDSLTDVVTINASIDSNLVPYTTNTYDIGTPSHAWRVAYINNLYASLLSVPTLNIGNLSFSANQISSASGTDLKLYGTGTGGVTLGNFRIKDNVITNISLNAVTVISQTGTGYFKIDTTNGFVPPVGSTSQRPDGYEVVGMTRYNTDTRALEIFDGSTWGSPAGSQGSVNTDQAQTIAAEIALMLG